MRGLGRNSGNDLVLAVRPGWTHSVVLKISVVSGFEVYDAAWLRNALADRKIEACIPSKSNRKTQIPHDRVLYRKRHKIENMFGNLKDWRRIHTRSDPCACGPLKSIWPRKRPSLQTNGQDRPGLARSAIRRYCAARNSVISPPPSNSASVASCVETYVCVTGGAIKSKPTTYL